MIFIAIFSGALMFTIYPTSHTLRPATEEMRNNFFTSVIKGIYSSDRPRCVFPSIHCLLSIVISVGLIFSDSFKGKLWPKIVCPIFAILVMLSTVFIKQHSFADVLLAMGMSVPTCLLTYFVVVPKKRFSPKSDPADVLLPDQTALAAESAKEPPSSTDEIPTDSAE